MSDREHSRDRPGHHPSSSGSGAGGALSFLPSIFGRRPPAISTRATSDTARGAADRRGSIEDLVSPRRRTVGLPSGEERKSKRNHSPAPFDPEAVIAHIAHAEPKDEATTAEVCEYVKAIAVYLVDRAIVDEDEHGFYKSSQKDPHHAVGVTSADLQTLYIKAIRFANPRAAPKLRIAAKRLLAALIAIAAPGGGDGLIHVELPESINIRTLYGVITSAAVPPGPPNMDEINVEVGALNALTKNGTSVQLTEGIVGWLIRTVEDMSDAWMVWCTKRDEASHDWEEAPTRRKSPFAPIKPASPAEALSSIIDLISAVVSKHSALFSTEDLHRILGPLLTSFFRAAVAEVTTPGRSTEFTLSSLASQDSPASSALNSPAVGPVSGLGLEPSLRRSLSTKRPLPPITSTTTAGTPAKSAPARQSSGSESHHSAPPPGSPSVRSSSPPPGTAASRFKWARPIPSFCALVENLVKVTTIPDDDFAHVIALACLALGQIGQETVVEAEMAATELMTLVLDSDVGRRAEQAIRLLLEGKASEAMKLDVLSNSEVDRRATKGAVAASQMFLRRMETSSGRSSSFSTCPLASIASSLRAAQSASRFQDAAERVKWEPVDYSILSLLLTHLTELRNLEASEGRTSGDAWAEGEAAGEILEGFVTTVTSLPHFELGELKSITSSYPQSPTSTYDVASWMQRRASEGPRPSLLLPMFEAALHQLPKAVGHLHASTSTDPDFQHPRYIELLLRLAAFLDEEDAHVVVDFYKEECLCLPFTEGWIDNIWKLLNGFYLSTSNFDSVRKKVAKLLFEDVYGNAEDFTDLRTELVSQAILPFLGKVLFDQVEEEFQHAALAVLVKAAVVETVERDEERRSIRARKALRELEEEDATTSPSDELKEAAAGGTFDAIRTLLIKVATQTACRGDDLPNAFAMAATQSAHMAESLAFDRRSGRIKESTSSSGLKSLVGSISPPIRTTQLPTISAISATMASTGSEEHTSPPPPLSNPHPHTDCKSLHAVIALIAIFSRLSFSPPHSLTSTAKAARTPASSRCITIFRDLLGLLFPMTDDQTGSKLPAGAPKIPARCPRARLVILQWFMRLRADNKHRLFVRSGIDDLAMPFAAILRRTRETETQARAEMEESRRRSRPSQAVRGEEERGRTGRTSDPATRSRSRSKQPVTMRGVDHTYNPLWILPDPVMFEIPPDEQPSEGLTTYDPNHPSLQIPDAPPVEGVWLPVSEYVRVLNGILRGHDWELVSYVLCFLPLQLRNKLFFHGHRAVREVRALLDVLCNGVLGTTGRWETRFNVPTFIKRVEINAVAYQSLSIMIAYRGVISREGCDHLVRAFTAGLEARKELAKPCLQALMLCIYELETYVGRHLVDIVTRMGRIVTTSDIAVHVLEFTIALGQNGTLYRNFTDEQYRRVFHIAIDYIGEHNSRSDQPIDLSKSREEYTLSQHVIGLAYYAIYIWFLALRLPQRPKLVPEITRKLLQVRSQRTGIDEMAEVCFDWLARYTYGNADPKPATSFLSEVVMKDTRENEPPKSQSWLLGGAIITITSHARSGWATILTTRPTGTTSVVCKLENVPMLELGEANADLVSLPAFLMANRDQIMRGEVPQSELEDPDALAQVHSSLQVPDTFNQGSQHGYIWSGATPSQRRKDVLVEPSYLALQLLSSYPNASLETPRGRLIPNEERFSRALRGITNTPVIDTLKIAVLYVGRGQTTETEILGNIDGSPLYLDFLSGLGRLIRLKGQVDIFVGGLNRDNDSDGEYAYAWWDDFSQVIFHTPTMMPNLEGYPTFDNKKRLVGNDYVKIVYNESGKDFEFDTIRTAWNFVNIVISPLTVGDADVVPGQSGVRQQAEEGWSDWDREEWFKVEIQTAPGIPDFTPLGEGKMVSRRAMPILVRHVAHLANDMAARFTHIRDAADAASAEYITSWRSRLRAMARLRASLPAVELPPEDDATQREEMLRDFTRSFSYRPTANE